MARLYDYVLAQDDPFEFIYEAISGTHGVEMRDRMLELYSDVAVDFGYHPDDGFEEIIGKMIQIMEDC